MKHIVALTSLILWIIICNGQIVTSSCSAPDSIISIYNDDADRLALRKIHRNNLIYIDSVNIPQTHSDTILDALIAVYNAATLSERDTVTSIFEIHSFPDYVMNKFSIAADSSLYWMKELKNGNLTTGNSTIDSAITKYGLRIVLYQVSPASSTHTVSFNSKDNYNLLALTKTLDTISGVQYVEPDGFFGDGNNILDSVYNDHVELIYSIGWGDCPSGCTGEHLWKFNVYFDCSVEFVESYGNPLNEGAGAPYPKTGILTNKTTDLSVYPNPTTDNLNIAFPTPQKRQLNIYNINGALVHSDNLFNQLYQLTINTYPKGIYLLEIVEQDNVYREKLVVE